LPFRYFQRGMPLKTKPPLLLPVLDTTVTVRSIGADG
jgi:hypothetical protein